MIFEFQLRCHCEKLMFVDRKIIVDIEAHFFVDVANIDYQSIKVCATTFGPNCQFFLKASIFSQSHYEKLLNGLRGSPPP